MNKKCKISFYVFCIVLILSGCLTTSYNTEKKSPIDAIKDMHRTFITFNDDIDNPSYIPTTDFFLSTYGDNYERFSMKYLVPQKPIDSIDQILIISITYKGDNWRFMDGDVRIKLDDDLFSYNDDQPYTDVLDGGNVKEVITIYAPDINEKIKTCENFIIQFWADPIKFDENKIRTIKDFINKYYGLTYEELGLLYQQQEE